MVQFEHYLTGLLSQIKDSIKVIEDLKDIPGDLKIIKKELAKINGLFQVIANKLEGINNHSDKYVELSFAIKYYLDNYFFEREIETMEKLYSNDSHRLKNIRYSILKALSDKKLLEKVDSIMKD
ncbi:MAG: hypothetical protein ACE5RN_01120 [Nitrosopumilaceae archaeon]